IKDRPTAQTTLTRSPVEIASPKNKIADGAIAVGSVSEAIEDLLLPFADRLRRQFVNSADIMCPAVISSSVDPTRSIEEQRSIGKTPVRLALERINRPEIPLSSARREFENNSASIGAAAGSRPIEVAIAQNHPSSRACGSVRAARKSVNDLEDP